MKKNRTEEMQIRVTGVINCEDREGTVILTLPGERLGPEVYKKVTNALSGIFTTDAHREIAVESVFQLHRVTQLAKFVK